MGLRCPGAKGKKKFTVTAEPMPRPWTEPGLTRAERVIRFIESLRVTSGALAGQRFTVRDWQREIIEAWYREENGRRIVRTGLLSVARKNGKTGLCAALALCHLLGPEMERRGQICVGATDRDPIGLDL
jgi:phage terminase large subunit-like protein